MKYELPGSQGEILPNLLGLKTGDEVALAEFEGFLKAEILLTEALTKRTKFNIAYILKIHRLALGHLYSFAGKYRDVNISKGGFPFAAARFLAQTMQDFEEEVLRKLPNTYESKEVLIRDIAVVHGEILVIHPFREGNGRTARILANLMTRKQGYPALEFEKVGEEEFEFYIAAVQKAAEKDYSPMIAFIKAIFPD
ncbi:Fic/DOC family protein [Adhaeribacter pallidiroseus]|uniref:protein adenylyltransferase n=1 Tax=Adhaeribacter pallidiroseus TaxID=2072847 RepID=A0A369QP46_9BACT|nr:Fic family protein [Adhaeribacter pallidiroseus]RDC63988.1 Adenosine monophosphate-protein transferase FICD like protein [Adhaeribacter pallidiroseus]